MTSAGGEVVIEFFSFPFESVIHIFSVSPLLSFTVTMMKQPTFPPVTVCQCVTVHVVTVQTKGVKVVLRKREFGVMWEVLREQQGKMEEWNAPQVGVLKGRCFS